MIDILGIFGIWPWSDASGPFGQPQGAEDLEDAVRDRVRANAEEARPGERRVLFPVIDLERAAAAETYPNGKTKRTRWRPVDLSTRVVLIGLHQAGVERGEQRWMDTVHRVTCHRAIGPSGNRYRVHPLDRRLVAINRLDRRPFHTISIEVLGNFEGVDGGRPDWWKPEVMGRGYPDEAQISALRQEILAVEAEVRDMGGRLSGIVPHRVSGRNRRGKPNRPICPGSRVWSAGGEWAAAELGVPVPAPGQTFGGLPIPESWHGDHWPRLLDSGLTGIPDPR